MTTLKGLVGYVSKFLASGSRMERKKKKREKMTEGEERPRKRILAHRGKNYRKGKEDQERKGKRGCLSRKFSPSSAARDFW